MGPHGALRLVEVVSARLVKTGRAPSRYSRDTRLYGLTTKAMRIGVHRSHPHLTSTQVSYSLLPAVP